MSNNDVFITPSVLDRLIDLAPEKNTEQLKPQQQIICDLYNNIKRDLENLLNSRCRCISWDTTTWSELEISLFNYGIMDFTGTRLNSTNNQNAFCHHLEQVLIKYESRFKTVKVTLLNNSNQYDRVLHLRIEALLNTSASFETIIFDSVLEPKTRNFQINY